MSSGTSTTRPGTPTAPSFDGVLVVDKPAGPTSHDIVGRARRALGTRRVGHTGTLDPFATGVLVLVLGRATRLAQFLSAARKEYRAEVRLGIATDTYDLTGTPVGPAGSARLPSAAEIEAALRLFRGRIEQVPPPYSAKKIQGVPAYSLARRARPVRLAPVAVDVFRLDVERLDGDRLVLVVECSAGFYVRALAHDLGEALACGAHLSALRRTRNGEFDETSAVGLGTLEQAHDATDLVVPLDRLLRWMPGAHLSDAARTRVAHGNAVTAGDIWRWEPPVGMDPGGGMAGSASPGGELVRLVGPDGRLLAVGRRSPGGTQDILQPYVVLV